MGNRAAIFDVDRTLIPGSSLFLLARGMYSRDFYRVRDLLRFAAGQFAFQLFGESQKRIDSVQSGALEFVTGRTQAELREMGVEIAEERILPRVYEGITKVIESHKANGDLTFLATAAPMEVAEILADSLGMTGAVATRSEVDDQGRYTGQLVGGLIHGEAKAEAVKQLAAKHDIDLSESYAYSDSKNDIPLLNIVGHPAAVNPDAELKRVARANGWPVYELRTKRLPLLIGVPSAVAGFGLLFSGIAIGRAMGRRAARKEIRELID